MGLHWSHATRVCLGRWRERFVDWVRTACLGIAAGDEQIRDAGVKGLLDIRVRVSWPVRTSVVSCLSKSVINQFMKHMEETSLTEAERYTEAIGFLARR